MIHLSNVRCSNAEDDNAYKDAPLIKEQTCQRRVVAGLSWRHFPGLTRYGVNGLQVGQKVCGLVMIFALAWGGILFSVQPAMAQGGYQIFIPTATNEAIIGLGGDPEPAQCALNEQESLVAQFAENDPGQQRERMVCDPILAEVARAKARDMALRGYFSHTSPEGEGPNLWVREAGYPLPDWYGSSASSNNIESIGAGYPTPDAAWAAWLNSQTHQIHVLGTQSFYADQEAYGVGYYYNADSEYKHYWVFLSAPIAD